MSIHVKRKDSDDGAEDYYKFADAKEDKGYLLVFDPQGKQLARYPMENVSHWRTS